MSAMTVSVAQTHCRAYLQEKEPRSDSSTQTTQPGTIVRATAGPSAWRLTDRGIAVVMVLAATILTVALAVIGVTAVRVTGADYGADVHKSQVDQR